MTQAPTLEIEHRLGGCVIGMDEVGRGALAGPVAVGAVLVDASTLAPPEGLRDSKLLTPARREALVGPVHAWCLACAVGMAAPDEVDRDGIIGALRLAGNRALAQLPAADAVLLDGSHDWLTDPMSVGLLAGPDAVPPVTMQVKGDLRCASVAAASVLAKVARDATMVALDDEHPGYGFAAHKGYSAPVHLRALAELGPCPVHRVSWSLPGVVYGGASRKEAGHER